MFPQRVSLRTTFGYSFTLAISFGFLGFISILESGIYLGPHYASYWITVASLPSWLQLYYLMLTNQTFAAFASGISLASGLFLAYKTYQNIKAGKFPKPKILIVLFLVFTMAVLGMSYAPLSFASNPTNGPIGQSTDTGYGYCGTPSFCIFTNVINSVQYYYAMGGLGQSVCAVGYICYGSPLNAGGASGTIASQVFQKVITTSNDLSLNPPIMVEEASYTMTEPLNYTTLNLEGGGMNETFLDWTTCTSWAFQSTNTQALHAFYMSNIQIQNCGVDVKGADFGYMNYVWVQGVSGPAIQTDITGGNTFTISNCVIDQLSKSKSVGIAIKSDWVHIEDTNIARTRIAGIIVGNSSASPTNDYIENSHFFYVEKYALVLQKCYLCQVNYDTDELNSSSDGLVDGAVYSNSTNTNGNNEITQWSFLGTPSSVNSSFVVFHDGASNLKIDDSLTNARSWNYGSTTLATTSTGFQCATITHGLAAGLTPNNIYFTLLGPSADLQLNASSINAVGATSFQVCLNINKAVASSSVIIYWQASYSQSN